MKEGMGIAAILIVAIYFLPTLVAFAHKKCPNKVGVLLLNLLLGWSVIGWIIALVMACSNGSSTKIVVNNHNELKS